MNHIGVAGAAGKPSLARHNQANRPVTELQACIRWSSLNVSTPLPGARHVSAANGLFFLVTSPSIIFSRFCNITLISWSGRSILFCNMMTYYGACQTPRCQEQEERQPSPPPPYGNNVHSLPARMLGRWDDALIGALLPSWHER